MKKITKRTVIRWSQIIVMLSTTMIFNCDVLQKIIDSNKEEFSSLVSGAGTQERWSANVMVQSRSRTLSLTLTLTFVTSSVEVWKLGCGDVMGGGSEFNSQPRQMTKKSCKSQPCCNLTLRKTVVLSLIPNQNS